MKETKIKNKELIKFIKSTKKHIDTIDNIMKSKVSIERQKLIAKEMNRFNFDFDVFLHFACGIPLNKLKTISNKSFNLNFKNKPKEDKTK